GVGAGVGGGGGARGTDGGMRWAGRGGGLARRSASVRSTFWSSASRPASTWVRTSTAIGTLKTLCRVNRSPPRRTTRWPVSRCTAATPTVPCAAAASLSRSGWTARKKRKGSMSPVRGKGAVSSRELRDQRLEARVAAERVELGIAVDPLAPAHAAAELLGEELERLVLLAAGGVGAGDVVQDRRLV